MPTSGAGASAWKPADSSAPQRAATSRVRPSSWRGAPCSAEYTGGQSGVGQPGTLPPGPVTIGARSDPVRALEPGASEKAGNSAACRTGRRRACIPDAGLVRTGDERTGDMAHLAAPLIIRFFFACVKNFLSVFIRSVDPLRAPGYLFLRAIAAPATPPGISLAASQILLYLGSNDFLADSTSGNPPAI